MWSYPDGHGSTKYYTVLEEGRMDSHVCECACVGEATSSFYYRRDVVFKRSVTIIVQV